MFARRIVASVAVLGAVVSLTSQAAAQPSAPPAARQPALRHAAHPGAPGAGDPYFPYQGNGGYDVSHYDLLLSYHPSTHFIAGTETVTAVASTDLSRFNLDLRRFLHVQRVVVGSATATFQQARSHELVITPSTPIPAGETFVVYIHYSGHPHAVHDPDGSLDGFIHTGDGAFVACEPQGAPSWFAVNDTPDDKATYQVGIDVPNGLAAISNGRLVGRTADGPSRTAWYWRIDKPISSYLVTATIGKFTIKRGRTPDGVPYLEAVDPQEKSAWQVLRRLPAIVDYFSKVYGRYPFNQTGAIVDHAPRVGYALETATRPLFDSTPDVATLAHELAHQWYGDTVTLHHWRDIWINEGFAEFSSWLWTEHTGGPSAAKRLRDLLAQPASSPVWNPPPGNPGDAAHIFAGSVYERGAGTLEALRQKLGDRVFFRIMRGWLAAHRYGNAQVGQFTAYAAQVAHRDLTAFFQRWLYQRGKPTS